MSPKAVSKAQARFFGAQYSRGEMSKHELEKRTKGIKYSELPAKIGKKKRRVIVRRKKRVK